MSRSVMRPWRAILPSASKSIASMASTRLRKSLKPSCGGTSMARHLIGT